MKSWNFSLLTPKSNLESDLTVEKIDKVRCSTFGEFFLEACISADKKKDGEIINLFHEKAKPAHCRYRYRSKFNIHSHCFESTPDSLTTGGHFYHVEKGREEKGIKVCDKKIK